MSALNVKIDKFTGRNNFSLWQIKMRTLLKQQGPWTPLVRKATESMTAEMVALEEKAHSTIMLCLADDIITEIAEEETASGLWCRLESLYMTKSLTNKLLLKQRLVSLRMQEEVKVVAVFDAMLSGLPNHKESFAGIDVIFSSDTCADAWIEKEVVALREDGCPKVWVVTSDVCHQQAAHGAGAFVWSCKALVSEIKASEREFEQILHEHRSTSMQGKLLQHNLCPEVVGALKDLKKKLSENEAS